MKIFGLVGGIGSGKSTVAKILGEMGAKVLDADKAGHRALEQPNIRELLVDRWGKSILSKDGNIDRGAVASRVFGNSVRTTSEREFLESVVHPEIRHRLEAQVEEAADSGVVAVVIDAALLFEAGWDEICDSVLFVESPRDSRLLRVEQRGWSEQEFAAREAAQLPITEKRSRASSVVNNTGSISRLREQIVRFWSENIDVPGTSA